MERSFARSTRYGFKRARWRRLWRVEIQEYLTAAIQNMMVLINSFKEPSKAAASRRSFDQFCQSKPQNWLENLLSAVRGLYLSVLDDINASKMTEKIGAIFCSA